MRSTLLVAPLGLVLLFASGCGSAAPAPQHERALLLSNDGESSCEALCAKRLVAGERLVTCHSVGLPDGAWKRYRAYDATACFIARTP